MKTLKLLSISLMLLITSLSASGSNEKSSGNISIQYSQDLSVIAGTWSAAYNHLFPDQNIRFVKLDNASASGISLVTDGYLPANQDQWKMIVGRNAVVPLISPSNPYLAELAEKGATIDGLSTIAGEKPSWKTITGYLQDVPVHVYIINEESAVKILSKYFKKDLSGAILVESNNELIQKVQSDPLAIGFCSLSALVDPQSKNLIGNLKILPIDRNGNGRMDKFEEITGNLDVFLQGVWTGKYPKDLCQSLYFTAALQPTGQSEVDFIKWVLKEGQDYLRARGYADLGYTERTAKAELLEKNQALAAESVSGGTTVAWLIFIAILLIAGILIPVILHRRKVISQKEPGKIFNVIHENSITVPKGIFFDKSHTWAYMEKDGLVRIGLDDFMPRVTGPITRVFLKQPGERISKGEKIITIIQEGKQLNILAPVSGIIRSGNSQLTNHPYLLNDSPFNEGWIYLIEPANWLRETSFLFMSEKYSEWIRGEFGRIRDFFASYLPLHEKEYAHVVLQDGGELRENILKEFGPEVWEDFQTKFIETSL